MTRATAVVVIVALFAWAALALAGWPASQYRHNDFAGFWVGSRLLLEGVDPYDPAAFLAAHEHIGSLHYAINPPGIGYGYPLTAAIVFAPFALLPLELAAPLWLVVQLVLAGVALVFLARTLAPDTLRRDAIVLVGLAAASQPVWLLAVGGNVGGFLLAIAATTAALLIAERPFLGGSAAGWLVVKPHPLLLALPLVLFTLDRRVAARAILGLIAVAAPIVALSLAVRPGWIGEFLVSAGSIGGAGLRRSTVFGLVPNIGLAIAIVAVLVGAFVLWVRSAHPRRAAVISAAVPISLFSAPYGWSYDHILLLVSAAIVIAQVATAHARVRFAFLIALAVVLVPLTWSLYAIAFRRGDEGLSGITPLAMLIVVAAAARVRTTTDTA